MQNSNNNNLESINNPVSEPIVDQTKLQEVNGGAWYGWFLTISAECSPTGRSCNPFYRINNIQQP